jgi:hypothetical protein
VANEDRRDVGLVGDEAPLQQWLREGDRLKLSEILGRVLAFEVHQVIDDQVVFFGVRVLKVGDRIDPCRERKPPRPLRDLPHGREGLGLKHLARVGREDDQGVVVLGVDLLQLFERSKLRVVFTKEILVVVLELDEPAAACGEETNAERADEDEPSPPEQEVHIGSDAAAVR